MDFKKYTTVYGAYNKKYINDFSQYNNTYVKQAGKYIADRGLYKQLLQRHDIGVCIDCPETIDVFKNEISSIFDYYTEIDDIGLSNPEFTYQFLRNRITIPIKNDNGDIVGFCGRDFTGKADAKYLYTKTAVENSPLTKSSTLYNIENIDKVEDIFVVEGFFDVYALEKQGFTNVVGLMGVSISNKQMQLLKNHGVQTVNLALDNDNAGLTATHQLGNVLRNNGFNVNVYQIPTQEKDLDEFFLNGHSFRELKSYTYEEFYLSNVNWNNEDTYFQNKDMLFRNLKPEKAEDTLVNLAKQSGLSEFDVKTDYVEFCNTKNIEIDNLYWVQDYNRQKQEMKIEFDMKMDAKNQFINSLDQLNISYYIHDSQEDFLDLFINGVETNTINDITDSIIDQIGINDELLSRDSAKYIIIDRFKQLTLDSDSYQEYYNKALIDNIECYMEANIYPRINEIVEAYGVNQEMFMNEKEFFMSEINYKQYVYNEKGLECLNRIKNLMRLSDNINNKYLEDYMTPKIEQQFQQSISHTQLQTQNNSPELIR